MEAYIQNYKIFNTNSIVYDFNVGDGGIGDYVKFFMFILESCMKNNKRVYCKKNNTELEKYIKLKYDILYVNDDMIKTLGCVQLVKPPMFHSTLNTNYSLHINEVFYFTDEVKANSTYLFPPNITEYISIHIRLGDKLLETDARYLQCPTDIRIFSEEKIYKFIEENYNKNIFLCCDNNTYKLKIKEKYSNIIITNCDIGHTSLFNTTKKQVLDSVTELYILTNSQLIFAGSNSGFSLIASKFNNITYLQ